MSSVSPCGRYEWTGETKEVGGVTVRRYRVRPNADPNKLPRAASPGKKMGFIDDWEAVRYGGAVCGNGVAIGSTLYDNAIVCGRVDKSELGGGALVQADAHALGCDLNDASMVLNGAQVADVTMRGDSIVHGKAIVMGGGNFGVKLSSIEVPSDAEILSSDHLLALTVTTTSQLTVLAYRKKGGGARVEMGCWGGTIDELEELFMRNVWVETQEVDCERLRPAMLAMVAFFRQITASW